MPPFNLAFLDQIAILVREHMALDLADRIDGDIDDDQQAGAAKLERRPGPGDEIFRDKVQMSAR